MVGVDRGRELTGGSVGWRRSAPVVVVVGRREGHLHGRRRRRVIVPVLRVVLRRVGVGVLWRVRRGGSEHVAVRGNLRLLGRRRRLVVVAMAVAGAPTAVTRGASSTVATRVAHALAQITGGELAETTSNSDLEASEHGNWRRPSSPVLRKSGLNWSRKFEKKEEATTTLPRIRSQRAMELDPLIPPREIEIDERFDRGRGRGTGEEGSTCSHTSSSSLLSRLYRIFGAIMEGCA